MKKLAIIAALLLLEAGAYAGPAAVQLGSMSGAESAATQVQPPPPPSDTKAIDCINNPMIPGCPKYCHTIGWGSPACPAPLYCNTNPNGYGCPKSADARDAESGDENFDPGLAKANCAADANAPGCPLFCKDHHSYSGCPMYCELNPLAPACGHIPEYCGTNPNGYGCPKSAGEKDAAGGFDMGLAKANCGADPNAAGCPLYCKDHHAYPGCPMYCQLNPLSPACGHIPAYCGTNPNGYGCPKALEAASKDEASGAGAEKGFVPPHPQYCQHHHGLCK